MGTSSAAFALSLAGIANTQGQIKPNGDAAALAKKLELQSRGPCHRPVTTQQGEV